MHVARIGDALAAQQFAVDGLALRPCVRDPSGALGGRPDQLGGTLVAQMPKAEVEGVDAGRRRELVDVRLVREDVGQRRDAAQPRGAQDRRHVVGDHAQVGVVVGWHGRAVAHLVGRGHRFDGACEQQGERGRAVRRIRGAEVVAGHRAVGRETAVDLHELGRALGLPQMLLLARELHAHRSADRT